MRVLFLTPRPLGDPRSGGTIKSAALLSYLERRHEVDVACLLRPGERWERAEVGFPLDRPRSVGRLLASYGRRVPISIERNRSPALAEAIERLVADRPPGAVFVDGWLMAQYLPRGRRPALLHQHNAEHVMWRRQAALERSRLRRAVVRREASRVRSYEARMLGRFDAAFAVSEPDRAAMVELGAPAERIRLLPNVPAPSLLDRPALHPVAEPALLFFGTLSWPPNVAGLVRFIEATFPALRAEVPGARFLLAGSGAPPALVALASGTPGVEFLGDVEDDERLYRRARATVDPGVGGAGTRVKLLNALARGLPAVASPDAAGGLEVVDGEHLLVARDRSAAVRALVRLLTDDDTWRRLSAAGRELIRTRYVPEVAFGALDEVLGALGYGQSTGGSVAGGGGA
jgi:glycosyltransferase involved in cell wall biosynthesis